ncbi:MAG: MBL fold metallo-hydrolase [Burkholderiales bacterium]
MPPEAVDKLRVRFWGTRGSIPVSLTSADIRRKLEKALLAAIEQKITTSRQIGSFLDHELDFSVTHTYGGHSPCVEFDTGGGEFFVCDLGSGARPFGNSVLSRSGEGPATVNVFMSHVHWDHIMGFPFFAPAYVPGTRIVIHGCHETLEQAFRLQQSPPCFPVEFSQLAADIRFVRLEPGKTHEVSGFRVTPKLQRHTGDSYGYRFERSGKTVIYSTDSEHRPENAAETASFVEFFRDANLVIFDAMYSLADAVSVKEDWGHSSNVVGVELCQMAGVEHLCLFHHEPAFDDERIESVLKETLRLEQLTRGSRPLQISAAFDGLEIEV